MVVLKINNVEANLYGDESLEVVSKVKDSKEIGKIFTDYSTTFAMPASSTNNKIFRHFHNAGVIVTTDYRVKNNAVIELDTIPFREGQIKLEEVKIVNGKPSSYSVTFFGNGVNLSDAFGDDKISDLLLTSYNHEITLDVVEDGLNSATQWNDSIVDGTQPVKNDDIIYPLVNNTKFEWLANAASPALGLEDETIVYSHMKPAIKVRTILSEIESKYNITLESTVFDSDEFNKLYIWAPIIDNNATGGFETREVNMLTAREGMAASVILSENYIDAARTPDAKYILANCYMNITAPFQSVNAKLQRLVQKDGGSWKVDGEIEVTGVAFVEMEYEYEYSAVDVPDKIKWQVLSDGAFEAEVWVTGLVKYSGISSGLTKYKADCEDILIAPLEQVFRNRLPNIEVSEFFNAILKLYNMVAIPNGTTKTTGGDVITNFYCESYNAWKAIGKRVDLTKYFDVAEVSMFIPELPSEINFKYEEPEAANNKYFFDFNGYAYGDRKNTKTGGEEDPYDIEFPFENLLFDKIDAEYLIGKSQEANEDSTVIKPISDKAFLFYWSRNQTSAVGIQFTGGAAISSYKQVNTFINLASVDYTMNFGSEINAWTPTTTADPTVGRYVTYYEAMFTNLFDKQHRRFKMTATLPASVLNSIGINSLTGGEVEGTQSINLNDVVKIRDDHYNIEEMTVQLPSRKTEFTLSNYRLDPTTYIDGIDTEIPTAPVLSIDQDDVGGPTIGVMTAFTSVSYTTFTANWTAATDDGTITNYAISIDGDVTELGNVLTYDATVANDNTTYEVKVKAKDNDGNWSAYSAVAEVTTLNASPPAPVITVSPAFPSTAATFYEGVGGTYQISATNSPDSYEMYVKDEPENVPDGMYYNSTTGLITITSCPYCNLGGYHALTLTATNIGGTDSENILIFIVPN